ncbi:hypothetical protein RJ55_04147 [Drechmeria coniospora]|nr:hypothetical protein RJ55_04147 [Drechmeria coniospora]
MASKDRGGGQRDGRGGKRPAGVTKNSRIPQLTPETVSRILQQQQEQQQEALLQQEGVHQPSRQPWSGSSEATNSFTPVNRPTGDTYINANANADRRHDVALLVLTQPPIALASSTTPSTTPASPNIDAARRKVSSTKTLTRWQPPPRDADATPCAGEVVQARYDNKVVIDSQLCRKLANGIARREPEQRRNDQELNLARRSNVEALLAQVTGDVADVPCKNCHKGHGPWTRCVIIPGSMCGSCSNCWFNASGSRCTFHVTTKTANELFSLELMPVSEENNRGPQQNGQSHRSAHTLASETPRTMYRSRRNSEPSSIGIQMVREGMFPPEDGISRLANSIRRFLDYIFDSSSANRAQDIMTRIDIAANTIATCIEDLILVLGLDVPDIMRQSEQQPAQPNSQQPAEPNFHHDEQRPVQLNGHRPEQHAAQPASHTDPRLERPYPWQPPSVLRSPSLDPDGDAQVSEFSHGTPYNNGS